MGPFGIWWGGSDTEGPESRGDLAHLVWEEHEKKAVIRQGGGRHWALSTLSAA